MKRLLPFLIITVFLLPDSSAQLCEDWKAQSTAYVINGDTPNDPAFYQWEEISNQVQGVHLCVLNAEIIPIYIQQGNNYINFTSRFSPTAALMFMLQLEVNVNNNGFSIIYNGSARQDIIWYGSSATLSKPGEYNLKVRITFFDGSIRLREYHVKVIPSSEKLYKDQVGNTLRKWAGNDPNGLKAIVFSEGFDAYNTNGQEMYYHAASKLVECFNDNGYDVFLLDNRYGTQNIRNNASIFASAVEYISSIYGNELIVAGGVSMGGIISRYALARAEQEGDPLPVHTFIAIDSPHQGAMISEPLQNFKKANEEDDEFAKHALSNEAARQLLIYNAYDPGGGVHDVFFEELNTMNGDGYPHFTKNIGVSFSTDEPNPNSGCWYKITYHTGPLRGTIKTFDLTDAERLPGSWLPKDLTSMSPIIKQASYWWLQLLVPIAQPLYYPTIEFERFTDPAYITYESALDIRDGNSMFDVYIEPEETSWHDVLPDDIIEDIVNEVILTNTYFQHKNVIGRWNLLGQKVVAGNYVTPLLPRGDVRVFPGGSLSIRTSAVAMLRAGFSAVAGSLLKIEVDPNMRFTCEDGVKKWKTSDHEKVIVNKKLVPGLFFSLYPNPARDQVQIQMGEALNSGIIVEVYNLLQELVQTQYFPPGTDAVLDISHLPGGSYIVRVSDGYTSRSKKLIKF